MSTYVEWQWWKPEDGEEEVADARTWRSEPHKTAQRVAEDIAERKWHEDSPDYFEHIVIALRSPEQDPSCWEVSVRQEPVFLALPKPLP